MSARWIIGFALATLAVSTAGMLAGVEPFAGWYYLFAWYATIAIADAWGHLRDPNQPLLLARPATLGSLLAWSAVIWFSFELWNLRLENWYYVNVTDHRAVRWTGTALAFATVLPGLFTFVKLLAAYRVAEGVRTAPVRMTSASIRILVLAGIASAVLVLLWPRRFYPLVWGVGFFLIAPFNHRWVRRGLLVQIEEGRWTLALRLLASGAICGFLWELFNFRARTKWIYTVPGFEELKLFEMPVLGFLGFPPFALECYEMYLAAVGLGLARDWEVGQGREGGAAGRPIGRWKRVATGVVLAAISFFTLVLMDRSTIDSMTSRPADLPAVDPALAERLAAIGVHDVAELRDLLASPAAAARLGVSDSAKTRLGDQVELALLAGIGSRQAARLVRIGVGSVDDLARIEAPELERQLRSAEAEPRPRPARLRVWIRAARTQARRSAGSLPPR